jgi:hypothetical protein
MNRDVCEHGNPEAYGACKECCLMQSQNTEQDRVLEQPEQEPLAWLESPYGSIRMNTTMRFQFPPQSLKWKIPLYTHPPRREWRGLTNLEFVQIELKLRKYHDYDRYDLSLNEFGRAIEAALKENNHE